MGIDIYRQDESGTWRFAGNRRYLSKENGSAEISWKKGEGCMIYLPIRSNVLDFRVGVPAGGSISPLPHSDPDAKPIVHYGTSIVHGGCVSRSGLVFSSAVGRILDREVINLGFSGNGKMDLSLVPFLAEIDAAVYVVDCVWNLCRPEEIRERTRPFLEALTSKRPDTPILLCEGCLQHRHGFASNTALREIYDALKREDAKRWRHLHFFRYEDQLPVGDELTHDFCHPNDYGVQFMGPAYAKRINEVLLGDGAMSRRGKNERRKPDRVTAVRNPNYDRSRIGPYDLEDPLSFVDGRKVMTAEDWKARRREILGIFASEMYGAEPPAPKTVVTELANEKTSVAGFAIRRQYRMWFNADRTGPCINWIVWLPRFAKGPVPVISFLNYAGNHELVPDDDVPVTTAWQRDDPHGGVLAHRARAATRGHLQNPNSDTILPLGTILARGYAVMSACYAEVSPDPDPDDRAYDGALYSQCEFAYKGVFSLWGPRDPSRTDDITAIGAWAWSLSRGLDLAERIPEIDAKRAVVTGYSRLGKAALVAAARDERFAVCVPNQTGGGGAPLAKRDYGENVSTENRMFTHWYCRAYAKYAADPAKTLKFDQHLLLACVAPRALLIQGYDSPWFDTEGEYLAVRAASPVWEKFCGAGMPGEKWPDDFDTSAIGPRLGYVRRSQGHGISAYDWMWMLDFADGVLKRR